MPSQETIEAINAFSVVVLVIVTGVYAAFTYKILKATQRQANSAEETLRVLKEQTQELTNFGKRQIETVVKVAIETIQHWRDENIQNLVFGKQIPENIDLLPTNHESALESAHRISSPLASNLSSGLQEIRLAEAQLGIMKGGGDLNALFMRHNPRFLKHLDNAQEHLENAQDELHSEAG